METKIPTHIKASVTNTIGYSETSNKKSFMVGSSVSFAIAEEYYEPIIKQLKQNAEMYQKAFEQASAGIKTIATILNNYSE